MRQPQHDNDAMGDIHPPHRRPQISVARTPACRAWLRCYATVGALLNTLPDAALRLALSLGHWFERCDMLSPTHGSAECVHPGCNMGLTLDAEHKPPIHGSAATFPCASIAAQTHYARVAGRLL